MRLSKQHGNDHPKTEAARKELHALYDQKEKKRQSNMSASGYIWKNELDKKKD